jgi:precorrin-2 dehydrogenase/sirohydrochlorin ferrochelatase
MSEPYPLSLVLRDQPVAVIGGGTVAERKIAGLLDTGARLTVIAPKATDRIKDLAAAKKLTLIRREVIDEDLAGKLLVFVATSSEKVNRWVSRAARRRGSLVNCVDTPDECTFYVPSFFRRGSLTLSISTGGKIPALAKRLRKKLQDMYDESYSDFVAMLAQGRTKLLQNHNLTEEQRKKILEELMESALFTLITEDRTEEAPQFVHDFIEKAVERQRTAASGDCSCPTSHP